jgi:hypothetical protein
LFLGKVVASTLNDSSDFDGSTNNWFYITLTMLEHTRNEKMIEIFITTLFSDTETNGSDLTTRDILFSKLTSLSETVCISILTLLANVVKKWDGSVALLFGIRNSGGILDVSEHVHVLERMMAICGKDVDGMDSYVTDAVLAMEHISHRISTVSLDQPEADDELEQFESTLWNKLYDKLNLFYSQSVNVNLALTLLIKNITVEPNTNLYRILFTSEKDIVQVLERLHGEIAKDSKTRMRMDLVKKEMERDLNSKDKDRELIKNYVVLEEFVKEMVGCLMMRGSSCREHISFL